MSEETEAALLRKWAIGLIFDDLDYLSVYEAEYGFTRDDVIKALAESLEKHAEGKVRRVVRGNTETFEVAA